MLAAADPDVWRWQPHPEVWLLIIGALALGWYAVKVIGPKAVPDGEPVVTRAQRWYYLAAIALLWLASDWPMHDVSEEYLYFVHMVQHLLITFMIPPLILLATPEWLARLVVSGDGSVGVWIRRLTRPVVAGVIFNFVVALTHLPTIVNTSIESGPFHYLVHLVAFTAALLMWTPVCGPIKELRLSPPGQMFYLFLMSIVPTIPAAWLTFANGALYEAYDHPVRLWGISVATDQQAAGAVMKLLGGLYLWGLIAFLFFRWAAEETADRPRPGVASAPPEPSAPDSGEASPPDEASGDAVSPPSFDTFEDVQAEFDRAGPAPEERVPDL